MCGALAELSLGIALGTCANAQITPDTKLGRERSRVTSTGTVDQIRGGATRGTNLFHSFQDFNVGNGRSAYFPNPAGIENILSRVTGANPSNILGTLGVAGGNANLFLINPNGIIFGPNANLDVGGSFVGTTANAIGLANGDIFGAKPGEPLPTQLLNVNPNVFLFNQLAAQPIINRSRANTTGLQVPQGQSLLLVGGDVRLEGGRLFAPGGHVELGGLAGTGTVGLSVNGSDLRSSFPDVVERADVSLTNGASLNVLAGGGGSIAINARNLDVLGSSLLSGILPGTFEPGTQAGDIEINATDGVKIEGEANAPSRIINTVGDLTGATVLGSAGNIVVNTGSLNVIGNANIGSATNGQGSAGNVTIQARDVVSFSGSNSGGVISAVGPLGMGNGADINIQARSLSLSDGTQLITSTLGQGNAGNIQVNATDSVSVSGGSALNAVSAGQGNTGNVTITAGSTVSFDGVGSNPVLSGVYSTVVSAPGLVGNREGGNINIQAQSLSLTNGAPLVTSIIGQGNAGNIQVNATDSVSVRGGSTLATATFGRGDAGDITIVAGGTVSFDGGRTIYIDGEETKAPSAATSGVPRTPAISVGEIPVPELVGIGKGGNINIRAESFSLTNGAVLSSSDLGQGDAGNIDIAASSIGLDNKALLSSTTTGGQGNIILRSEDLVLRRGSNITTNATSTATGGNITIDTDVLATLEDSDISANAEEAFGGQVIIDAQGIFGTEFREDETLQSDITATSELGPQFSGTVELNTPDVDLSSGLVALPEEVVDVSGLVAQRCPAGGGNVARKSGEFVVTGRGGLPPNPSDPPSSDTVLADWITLNPELEESRSDPTPATNSTSQTPVPLVEAQGWVRNSKGQVVLTAQTPSPPPQRGTPPHNSGTVSASCHGS